MRIFEALLMLANLAAFAALTVPVPRAVRWLGYAAPIALVTAVVQVVGEGARWQIFPAYTLSGLFFLVWLRKNIAPADPSIARKGTIMIPFAFAVAVVLGVLALAVAVALPIVLPVFHLPRPSGPYAIGTVTYHWTDASRREAFSVDTADRRELMVQVWYPAEADPSSPRTPYIEDSDTVAAALARLHGFPDLTLKHLKYVTSNAVASAPVAGDKPDYPVLVFLEGLTGYRQMNTFQVEVLVSHGYIVVGIDQPGIAASVVFPDGHHVTGLSKAQMEPFTQQSASPVEPAPSLNRQTFKGGIIPYFAQDVSFTLDQLASVNAADPNGILTARMDPQRIGVFGVSYGGIVAAEASLKDRRLKACLVMDVLMTADVVDKGLQQPAMWITRPADTMRLERQRAGGWTEKDIVQTQTTMRAVYDKSPGDAYFVQVPGMFHIDLTDTTYLSPIFPAVGFSGPFGVQPAHDSINAYSLAFFDRHLKGLPAALLDGPAKQYPEIIFETRRR
jgi:pimeloyl-ACP methyl ester carboxylesterase